MVAHPHFTVSGRRALGLLPCCPASGGLRGVLRQLFTGFAGGE